MARQVGEDVRRTMSKAAESVGNVLSEPGKALDADTILAAMAKLRIEFHPNGEVQMPEFDVPPSLAKAKERALADLHSVPEKIRAFDQLVDRKREEWRAREASRKLVG